MFGSGKEKEIEHVKHEIAQLEGRLRKECNIDEKRVKNMIKIVEKALSEREKSGIPEAERKSGREGKMRKKYEEEEGKFIAELNKTKHIEDEIEKRINKLKSMGHSIGNEEGLSYYEGATKIRGHLVRGKESAALEEIRQYLIIRKKFDFYNNPDDIKRILEKNILIEISKLKRDEEQRKKFLKRVWKI